MFHCLLVQLGQVEHKAKSAWHRVANACNGLPPWIARREIRVLQRPVALRLHAGRIFHKKLVFFMTVLSTRKTVSSKLLRASVILLLELLPWRMVGMRPPPRVPGGSRGSRRSSGFRDESLGRFNEVQVFCCGGFGVCCSNVLDCVQSRFQQLPQRATNPVN